MASKMASPKIPAARYLTDVLFGTDGSGFVKQCLLIEPDVTGKESEYLIKTKIRLSVLME